MNIPAPQATPEDLYCTEGKAELIDGRIVKQMATGLRPNEVAANIYSSLRVYVRTNARGRALTDSMGFIVPRLPSGRQSFSPVTSYYEGPLPANRMRFINGPPTFAVEVRSENDYGPAADAEYEAKRVDYFLAGTLVVWDVDPIAETILCYRAATPAHPVVWARGENTDAEPAVPGWSMTVDDVFA